MVFFDVTNRKSYEEAQRFLNI
jgi:Ras family